MIKLKCTNCRKLFVRTKRNHHSSVIRQTRPFCSKQCFGDYKSKNGKIQTNCGKCNKTITIIKSLKHKSKSGKNFCSRSCSVTYHNTHKTKGYRRSKLELWLETKLSKLYPNLTILFNNKQTIDSELDIYIPSLKLAFELNGIFHYEPIFGKDKLNQIQNNDERKFQECLKQDIELCIMDTSSQKHFCAKSSKAFLDIICNLINSKLLP